MNPTVQEIERLVEQARLALLELNRPSAKVVKFYNGTISILTHLKSLVEKGGTAPLAIPLHHDDHSLENVTHIGNSYASPAERDELVEAVGLLFRQAHKLGGDGDVFIDESTLGKILSRLESTASLTKESCEIKKVMEDMNEFDRPIDQEHNLLPLAQEVFDFAAELVVLRERVTTLTRERDEFRSVTRLLRGALEQVNAALRTPSAQAREEAK